MLSEYSILRIPGPTPVPPVVCQAMSQNMIGHRSEDFAQLLTELRPRLRPLFGTKQDVILLTGSGTSALETAVVNALSEGEEVLVLVTGSFGQRFVQICQTYNLKVHIIETKWGEAVEPQAVQQFLMKHPKVKAVLATYCETSTAVLNPIKTLAQIIKQTSEALFIVDGVSCIGAVDARMDDWGIDILLTGSQKALMLPTGLAMLAISDQAWKRIRKNKQPRFYFDLNKYRQSLESSTTPYTPAISLLFGLNKVLDLIEEEGFAQVICRHELMRDMLRAACSALGLPLLTNDQIASPTVTAIKPHFNADAFRQLLKKKFNLVLAGGQNKLKGEIIRIGHMGYCTPQEMLQLIAILETGLKLFGQPVVLGQGVIAAQKVYLYAIQNHSE